MSCSGPRFFNSPADYTGGNNASAEALHCHTTGGMNKEGMAYKLCKKSFNNHYGVPVSLSNLSYNQ